jgi:hypothetical protein
MWKVGGLPNSEQEERQRERAFSLEKKESKNRGRINKLREDNVVGCEAEERHWDKKRDKLAFEFLCLPSVYSHSGW